MERKSIAIAVILILSLGFAGCGTDPDTPVEDDSFVVIEPGANIAGGEDGTPASSTPGAPLPSAPTPAPDTPDTNAGYGATEPLFNEHYSIPIGQNIYRPALKWVVDRDGATIPEDRQFDVLYDVLTGEPQCLTIMKTEAAGKNEYGGIMTRENSALFDLDGNLLYDWGEYTYIGGFGDYIIRQHSPLITYDETQASYYESGLWDFKTGQTMAPDAGSVEKLSDSEVLLLDIESRPLGTMSASGEKRAGFPAPVQYASAMAWNGYIIASSKPFTMHDYEGLYRRYLLTPGFEPIFECQRLSGSPAGNVLFYTEETDLIEKRSGIITTDGHELYRMPQGRSVFYYDEELIITNTNSNPVKYTIVRLSDGEIIYDGISAIAYDYDYVERGLFEQILVYKDGFLRLIGRDGTEISGLKAPMVKFVQAFGAGFYAATMETDTYMVLDADLNEIIAPGTYYFIKEAKRQVGERYYYYNVFVGERAGAGRGRYTDLIGADGSVLAAGLNDAFGVGYDRIAVRKGFQAGLMDWGGNWIVRQPIFSILDDD